MQFDLIELEQLAAEKEDENWRFRSFLKFYDGMTDEELDSLVYKTADEIGSAVDCTQCGRCCEKLNRCVQKKISSGWRQNCQSRWKDYESSTSNTINQRINQAGE